MYPLAHQYRALGRGGMNIASSRATATWKVAVAVAVALGLGFICAALAGCGSASTSTAGARPPTATAMPGPTCQTSQLALAQDRSGVALGHVGVLLRIDNHSPETCALEGYPTLQLLDAHQQPLPTHEQQTTMAYTFTVPVPQPVVLAPSASAYVHLEWSDVPPSGQPCSSGVAFLQITPPHNQTPLLIRLDAGACDGTIITSPLEPSAASS
jgi:hypothetical protein